MNSTSESLLSAVDVLIDNALSKLEYDKTVQGTIYSIVNLDTGAYQVKYSGNIFTAYAADLETTYEVDDVVYVLIPEGDFSNTKTIQCLVKSSSLSYGQMVSLTNQFADTSPLFDVMYDDDWSGSVGVVAGAPQDSEYSTATIFEADSSTYHDLFYQYSTQNTLLRLKASFLTQFHSSHSAGNYGITVEFYTQSGDTVSYSLDINSFTGSPYSFTVYSPQYVILQATTAGFITGVKSVKLFEEGFEYDCYVENGLVTDKQNTSVANIFVKDVEISFVEQQNLTNNLYYLNIATPKGAVLTNNITSVDLVARLVYAGENILSESTCTCQWYERDASVLKSSDNYDKNAGVGWSEIDGTSFNTLTLTASDIAYQKEYKVVVIYNDEVVMTDTEMVYNLLSEYDCELAQVTDDDEIQLQIVNNASSGSLVGNWYALFPDSSYSLLQQGENYIDITSYLLYSSVTFYCEVLADDEVICTLEHVMTSSDSEEDVTISYIGEDTFRYDANGDITVEDAEQERTLQVLLAWKDGVGISYTTEWLTLEGETISTEQIDPATSMIQNLWVDNTNILHYTIRQKYKVNYNNNSIIVKITTVDGNVYTFTKELLFLKDGDQGTNGTTYIAVVRPSNNSGVKLSGFQPLIYRSSTWQNTLLLRCFVYKDGELINNESGYTFTYKWTGANVTLTEFEDSSLVDYIKVDGTSPIISSAASPYVKIQVTIKDSKNDRTYDIYAYYPIDVSVGFTDSEISSSIDIDTIPSYIMYSSSGVNPSFYSNNIQFLYNSNDYSSKITSLTEDLLKITTDSNGLYYLDPPASFIFDNYSMALLKCTYSSSKYILHPIIMYLNPYGNEAINGWDGTTLELNEEGGYILAPQVGAGTKDSANRFTGVVMGQDSEQEKIGLYGYQSGVNTFGLLEDGTAFFGAKSGGGQINIDGTKAVIYGGGESETSSSGYTTYTYGGDASNGMTITLANLGEDGDTNAIKIGGGVFYVNYDGYLYASNVTVKGVIQAETGYIGGSNGWTIERYRIYSGTTTTTRSTHVELNSDPDEDYAIWAGKLSSSDAMEKTFAVSKTGLLYAKEGNIAGWIMNDDYLASDTSVSSIYSVGMSPSRKAAFWAGKYVDQDSEEIANGSTVSIDSGVVDANFLVTATGKLYCSDAEISGTIHATEGLIGCDEDGENGWHIELNRIYSGSGRSWVELNSNNNKDDDGEYIEPYAIWCGSSSSTTAMNSYFAVSKQGELYAKEGNIGGWTMTSQYLRDSDWEVGLASRGSILIWAGGDIDSDAPVFSSDTTNFYVTRQGYLYCNKVEITGDIYASYLECNKGEIGGWTITSTYLRSSTRDTYLYADGEIKCDYLDCDGGEIGGWTITSKSLYSNNTYLYSSGQIVCDNMDIRGDVSAQTITIYYGNYELGSLGEITGSTGNTTTHNIGIETTSSSYSIVFESAKNIRSTAAGDNYLEADGTVYINAGTLRVDCDAENQYGIYARFA